MKRDVELIGIESQRVRQAGLRVEIHEEDPRSPTGDRNPEGVNTGGLGDPAFLICNCDHFARHWISLRPGRGRNTNPRLQRTGIDLGQHWTILNDVGHRPCVEELWFSFVKSNYTTPEDLRVWISFEDPDEMRTWIFDVSFLESEWTCVYKNGCQGVLTGPSPELEQGCCSYGAHFVDKRDAARVKKIASTLSPEEWQYHKKGNKKGVVKSEREGALVTRVVDGACIFLNRPGFDKGAGCALHQVAVSRGENPMDLKPEVCWQLPLRREDSVEDDGHVVSTVRRWDRRHWGAGGSEFHWWCTDSPEAFVGHDPVYVTMEAELTAMVGKKIYDLLVATLDERNRARRSNVRVRTPSIRREVAKFE